MCLGIQTHSKQVSLQQHGAVQQQKKRFEFMWWPDSCLIPALGFADIKGYGEATDVSVLGAPSDLWQYISESAAAWKYRGYLVWSHDPCQF